MASLWLLADRGSSPTQNILSTLLIFLPDFLLTIRRPSFARKRLRLAMVAADYTPGEADQLPARHGRVASHRKDGASSRAADHAHAGEGGSRLNLPNEFLSRSAASVNTAFPGAMLPALHSSNYS